MTEKMPGNALVVIAPPLFQKALAAMFAARRLPQAVFLDSKRGKLPASGVLQVLAAGESPLPGLPPQDVFAPPLRLGRLLDRAALHLDGRVKERVPRGEIAFGPCVLNADENMLVCGGGIRHTLTEKERDILLALLAAEGGIVERKTLLEQVWGYGEAIQTHTLETHIYRLRQKIEKDPAKPALLLTEEPGYRLGFFN